MRLDKSARQDRRLEPNTFIPQPPSPLHGFHVMADHNNDTDVMIQHSAQVRGGVGGGGDSSPPGVISQQKKS